MRSSSTTSCRRSPAQTDTLEPWARRVEELSGGRVAIEIYPSMSLGGRPPELVGQARDGVVDLIWTVNGYTPGLFPRSEVFELPTVYINDPGATNLAMRALFASDLHEDYAGLHVLFLHVHAGNGIHTVDTEVRAPADVAGLNLRTPSRTGAWVIEALGANPVAMPVPDLPQALSRRSVDGALIPWEVAGDLRLQDQTGYQIEGAGKARFGTTVFQLSMNRDRWDSLPPDIQAAFEEGKRRGVAGRARRHLARERRRGDRPLRRRGQHPRHPHRSRDRRLRRRARAGGRPLDRRRRSPRHRRHRARRPRPRRHRRGQIAPARRRRARAPLPQGRTSDTLTFRPSATERTAASASTSATRPPRPSGAIGPPPFSPATKLSISAA